MFHCPYCKNKQCVFFCHGRDRLLGIHQGEKTYQRCPTCQAVLQLPPPNPEEIKTFYGEADEVYHAYKPQPPQKRDWSLIAPIPSQGHVIDIGCASGSTLKSFLTDYPSWQATGMDFSEAALKNARHDLPIHTVFIQGDILERVQSLPPNYYDLVICEHVIEHLLNPETLIMNIARILKKNGQALLGYPNSGSLLMGIAKEYAYHLDSPRHIYIPSHRSIQIMTRRAGLVTKNWEGQTYPSCAWKSLAYALDAPTKTYMQSLGIRIHSLLLKPLRHILPSCFSKINATLTKI